MNRRPIDGEENGSGTMYFKKKSLNCSLLKIDQREKRLKLFDNATLQVVYVLTCLLLGLYGVLLIQYNLFPFSCCFKSWIP